MAAPHVAGLAALLLAKNPGWTPDQVEARIVATADDKGPRGKDPYYGAGRVNAARALR
jgi:subtilisin family serine protease